MSDFEEQDDDGWDEADGDDGWEKEDGEDNDMTNE